MFWIGLVLFVYWCVIAVLYYTTKWCKYSWWDITSDWALMGFWWIQYSRDATWLPFAAAGSFFMVLRSICIIGWLR